MELLHISPTHVDHRHALKFLLAGASDLVCHCWQQPKVTLQSSDMENDRPGLMAAWWPSLCLAQSDKKLCCHGGN